jgi:hypothetical protein
LQFSRRIIARQEKPVYSTAKYRNLEEFEVQVKAFDGHCSAKSEKSAPYRNAETEEENAGATNESQNCYLSAFIPT